MAHTLAGHAGVSGVVMAYDSGRPSLIGHLDDSALRTVAVGRTRIVVIDTCLTRDADLRTQVESRVARGDAEALARLPGSYHHLVSSPDGMLVFGDVAGYRRVCTCRRVAGRPGAEPAAEPRPGGTV